MIYLIVIILYTFPKNMAIGVFLVLLNFTDWSVMLFFVIKTMGSHCSRLSYKKVTEMPLQGSGLWDTLIIRGQ